MVSEEQQKKINERILLVARELLKSHGTISNISATTGVPRSTIQRDLNNPNVDLLLGDGTRDLIKDILKENAVEGNARGGLVSQEKYASLKDRLGKFQGCRKVVKGITKAPEVVETVPQKADPLNDPDFKQQVKIAAILYYQGSNIQQTADKLGVPSSTVVEYLCTYLQSVDSGMYVAIKPRLDFEFNNLGFKAEKEDVPQHAK